MCETFRTLSPESISTGEDYVYFYYSVTKPNEIWNISFIMNDGFKLDREFRKKEGFGVYFKNNGRVRNFDIM